MRTSVPSPVQALFQMFLIPWGLARLSIMSGKDGDRQSSLGCQRRKVDAVGERAKAPENLREHSKFC